MTKRDWLLAVVMSMAYTSGTLNGDVLLWDIIGFAMLLLAGIVAFAAFGSDKLHDRMDTL